MTKGPKILGHILYVFFFFFSNVGPPKEDIFSTTFSSIYVTSFLSNTYFSNLRLVVVRHHSVTFIDRVWRKQTNKKIFQAIIPSILDKHGHMGVI